MSFGTTLVVIVAILAVTAMRIARYESRSRGTTRGPSARENELEREVLDLKKRIAVLERLVTDDRQSKAIAHEIEALRDR